MRVFSPEIANRRRPKMQEEQKLAFSLSLRYLRGHKTGDVEGRTGVEGSKIAENLGRLGGPQAVGREGLAEEARGKVARAKGELVRVRGRRLGVGEGLEECVRRAERLPRVGEGREPHLLGRVLGHRLLRVRRTGERVRERERERETTGRGGATGRSIEKREQNDV